MITKKFVVWGLAAASLATAGVVHWGTNSAAAPPASSSPFVKLDQSATRKPGPNSTEDKSSPASSTPASSPLTTSPFTKPPAAKTAAPKSGAAKFNSAKSLGSKSLTAKSDAEASPDLEGFTEPYRTINLAFEDMGTVEEVIVREGDRVKAGQTIARLNSTVHQALLAIAEQNMKSEGRLDAALADLKLRKERLQKLEPLREQGHARQEEVDRAMLEVAVAEANLRTAREELISKRLECDKIKAQIACRSVRASVDGVVTKVHKQMGEFVAPNSPDVVTIVQLDKLYATFTVSTSQAARLKSGEIFPVEFDSGDEASAVVEFVSPVTNAESGTVLVKLRIDNAEGRTRSGDRCRLRLAE
ncbi:MAG: efflux RND transporter periplasmic adaptor subunit [Pirellulales bacterium]